MAKAPDAAIEPGTVLLSRLRIVRMLGRGGMGVVYEVEDLVRDCRVALKVLSADPADEERRLRFEREARAASMLANPHVAKVLESGVLANGTPYFVMEYLDGHTLENVLDHEPVSCATAVRYVLEALEAVAEAHAAGLVHRDLKPANLFLATLPSGKSAIKVLDFGVVKDTVGDGTQLTVTGSSVGTPAYMAPEQVRAGGRVDARSDVWALGVTLYEIITGKMPFEASSVPAVLARILRDTPAPIRALRKDAPAALEAIVMRCMEKEPEKRFQSAADLADALRTVLPSLPNTLPQRTMRLTPPPGRSPVELAATVAAMQSAEKSAGETTTLDVAARTTAGTVRRRSLAFTMTSIIVVIAAGLLFGMALVTRARETAAVATPSVSATVDPPDADAPIVAPSAVASSSAEAPGPSRRPPHKPRLPRN
ncbi:MAG TPA: serine/threonine-protein kinase [Labilithrix sp.]|jgi:serine/threonine-protein kinase